MAALGWLLNLGFAGGGTVLTGVGSVQSFTGPGRALGTFVGPSAPGVHVGPAAPGTHEGPGKPGTLIGPGS